MDSFITAFPEGAVICRRGDYLLRRQQDLRWRVFMVEDLIRLSRLIPESEHSPSLMLEDHLLDSMAPAYQDEVYLLLTAYDETFANDPEARQAIELGIRSPATHGLLRPARDFKQSDCQVIRHS
jgi:hypothetical protein